MKKIILTYPHLSGMVATYVYRVKQVEQDVQYKPGDHLTETQVLGLCDMSGIWKVVILESGSER